MIWHAELLPKLLGFNTSSAGFAILKMLQEQPFLRSHALDQVVASACSVQYGLDSCQHMQLQHSLLSSTDKYKSYQQFHGITGGCSLSKPG